MRATPQGTHHNDRSRSAATADKGSSRRVQLASQRTRSGYRPEGLESTSDMRTEANTPCSKQPTKMESPIDMRTPMM